MQCIKHYGQWTQLDAANALRQARKIVDKLSSEQSSAYHSESRSLAVVDSSLDGILGQSNMVSRFLDAFIHEAQYSAFYYTMVIFSIMIFDGVLFSLIVCTLCTCTVCACLSYLILLFTRIAYFISLSHFCFHYFIYFAMTQKRVWAPRQLPQLHPALQFYMELLLCTVCIAVIVGISFSFGVYLAAGQVVTVYSPYVYYKMSMAIPDEMFHSNDLFNVP